MRVKVVTLGCKVNMYESEYIKELFKKNNDEIVNDKADIIVINTCSVTNQADAKSRKMIRKEKRNNPDAITVVCGCMAENHQNDLDELNVDILIGNKDKSKIIDYINEFKQTKTKIKKFYDLRNIEFEDMTLEKYQDLTRAYVKIEDGCNNFCSYCTIPYVRGKERSKDFLKCISEITSLVNMGHKEIVLTGIHTGNYNNSGKRLVDLINEISKLDNLKRIRISSIEITEIDDKFLCELKNNPKICNHLHIPLQCGSDSTLKQMNRKYDTKKFLEIIKKIRKVRPDINITTDVIVGFPTETDNDFESAVNFIKKVGFTKIHTFPFSKRDNTVAAKLKNIVSDNTKKEREKVLLDLSFIQEMKYAKKYQNKIVEVLIEQSNEWSNGHTSNYLNVFVNEKLENNKNYKIKIIKVCQDKIIGKVVLS